MTDSNMVSAVMVTEVDFDNAIMENTTKQLHNPAFNGHPDAAMTYILGGMAFAKEVKSILFGKEQNNE